VWALVFKAAPLALRVPPHRQLLPCTDYACLARLRLQPAVQPKQHTSYAPGSQAVTSRSESKQHGHSTYCRAPVEPVARSVKPLVMGRTQQLGGERLQRVQVVSYGYGVPVLKPVEGALLGARAVSTARSGLRCTTGQAKHGTCCGTSFPRYVKRTKPSSRHIYCAFSASRSALGVHLRWLRRRCCLLRRHCLLLRRYGCSAVLYLFARFTKVCRPSTRSLRARRQRLSAFILTPLGMNKAACCLPSKLCMNVHIHSINSAYQRCPSTPSLPLAWRALPGTAAGLPLRVAGSSGC